MRVSSRAAAAGDTGTLTVVLRCLKVAEVGLEAAIHRQMVRRLVAKVAFPDHVALIARCFELGRKKRHLQGPATAMLLGSARPTAQQIKKVSRFYK